MSDPRPGRFFDRKAVRGVAWAVVCATLASGVIGGLLRGLDAEPDWAAFSRESRYAWDHREIARDTAMFGYLPTTFMVLWPFTVWLPAPAGLFAFVGLNAAACLGSLLLLRRHWFAGRASRLSNATLFVWPLFLYVAHLQHPLQANQFTLWVLALCLAGLTALMKRRQWTGGFLLGAAGCLKVTPFLFIVYLVLKRQWRAVAGMVLAVVICDIAPAVVFFGPGGAIREHRNWLQRADWYSNRRFIEDPNLRVTRHGNNCSLAIVLSRWLRAPAHGDQQVVLRGDPPAHVIEATRAALTPTEFLTLDPMPPAAGSWSIERHDLSNRANFPRFHIADLSPAAVRAIWAIILAAVFAAVCWRTARRPTPPGTTAWHAEASVWMLLMFLPSPMMRDYYLALALPAYVVLWRAALEVPVDSTTRRRRGFLIAAIAVAYLSVLGLASHAANWYGIHLLTTAVLLWATAGVWLDGVRADGPESAGGGDSPR